MKKKLLISIVFCFAMSNFAISQVVCIYCYDQNAAISTGVNNLMLNGGFENTPCIPWNGSYHSFCPSSGYYDCNIANWTCTGGGPSSYPLVFNAASNESIIVEGNISAYFGNYFCQACSTTPDDTSCLTSTDCTVSGVPAGYPNNGSAYGGSTGVSLQQTVTGLTAGNVYVLEFWVGGESGFFTNKGLFAVDLGFGNIMLRDKPTPNIGGIGTRYIIEFYASSSSQVVKFTSWGHICNTCTELVLDDVRLYTLAELSSNVPSCVTSVVNVTASIDTSICAGSCSPVSAIASSGTPPYTYSWTPNIGSGSGPFSVCPSSTTTYVAMVTDSTGSTATDSVTVTVNSPPPATLDPSGTTTICNVNGIMLNANSGDYHYIWYQDGVIVQSGTNSNYFANSPGVYQVQVVDLGSGCSSMSQTATIVLGGGPVASIITSGGCGSILFNGGSVTLSGTATNAVSYLWSPGGQTTASIQVTQPGTYCVTAFDASGCPSDTPACTTINTTDVQCGQHGQKVILCHVPPGNPNNPQTLCIAPGAVPTHLANHPGDCLGPCSLYYPRLSSAAYDDDITSSFYIAAYPNPFSGSFSLEIFNSSSEPLNLSVYDMLGRVVERYNDVNEKTLVGSQLREGIYFVVAEQGDNMQRLRIVKE